MSVKIPPIRAFTRYCALVTAIPFITALILLSGRPATAAEWEIKGNATGSLYHKESYKWTEEPIRVFAVYDTKFLDDVTLIVGGKGEYETAGMLFELGQPGQANVDSNLEREKFVQLLKKSQGWLITATNKQVRETRYLSRIFRGFNVDMVPGSDGRENTLRIKIKDYGRNRRLLLHLNAYQVGQLVEMLEQVPDTLTRMSVRYGKRVRGGGLH